MNIRNDVSKERKPKDTTKTYRGILFSVIGPAFAGRQASVPSFNKIHPHLSNPVLQ
jgi:hypothetical protein